MNTFQNFNLKNYLKIYSAVWNQFLYTRMLSTVPKDKVTFKNVSAQVSRSVISTKKNQKDFLWALGHEATHQKTQSTHQTEPEKNQTRQNIKSIQLILVIGQKQIQLTSHEEIFWTKQPDTETQ